MTPNFKIRPVIYPGKTELIKQLPCVMPGAWDHSCCEGVDPAHYTTGSYAGFNRKNDRRILPLCRVHHATQSNMGEKSFWFPRGHEARELSDMLHILFLEAYYTNEEESETLIKMNEACKRFAV